MADLLNRRCFLQNGGLSVLGLLLAERAWAQQAEQPLPMLRPADGIDGPPIVSARAWAVADGRTGRLLWGNGERTALAMASTTKIMTAFIVLELAGRNANVMQEVVAVSDQAGRTPGSAARIRGGDRIAVRELLYGLLLPSGNDAAAALAEHFGPRFREPNAINPPSAAAFVAEMNRRAGQLNLAETRYLDPHGLGANQTSARNLTALAHVAMQNAAFRDYVRTRRHQSEILGADGERRSVTWLNTNRLLDIEGYDGIKTGTTTAAGSCLVASGRRGEDHLFVAVLGCTSNDSRYTDTRNLFRWAWRERSQGR
jgi:D-alanyl-D-alanine carboxypeptidase (penicillin-binding protein 5/6)